MVEQKRSPGLERWARPTDHVFRHGGLSEVDAEHAQFAVYARGAPQKVVQIQATDQAARFSIDGRPAKPVPLPRPSPLGTPTPAPPPQNGLRRSDFERLRPMRPTVRQHHPKDSVCRREARAFA